VKSFRPAWRIQIDLPDVAFVDAFNEAISIHDVVVTSCELDGGPAWRLIGHCAAKPDRSELEIRIAIAAASLNVGAPPLAFSQIPATDWVADYRKRIQPHTVGRFFIYPSHFTGDTPRGLVGICLDAGMAFGTGEHGSTAGCLRALDGLQSTGLVVIRALDMGCGTAILSIAVAALWPQAQIIGVDNDADSITAASYNVAKNGYTSAVNISESEGFCSENVRSAAPYDLLVANILAGPLMEMASDAAEVVRPGGHAILSGILTEQAAGVSDAFVRTGFSVSGRQTLDEWTTLVLMRVA